MYFYAPTTSYLTLTPLQVEACPSVRQLSVRPKIFNFVTKVEEWGRPCPMDPFQVLFYFNYLFV